jgi:peptide deformylase
VLTLLEKRLRESLAASDKGVGIAAPQIGIGARAILVTLGARSDKPSTQFFANPRIVFRSDDISLDYEGCLSVPDVCGLVRRNRSVSVEYVAASGAVQTIDVSGFDARIFQHEIDHLDGVLYVDRVEGGLQPKDHLKQLREQLRRDRPELASVINQNQVAIL